MEPTQIGPLREYARRLKTGIPHDDAPSILDKSYTITAQVEIPQGGAEGMLLTEGARFAGWGLYLLKGRLVFLRNLLDLERVRWEGQSALPPGKHTVEFDFAYDEEKTIEVNSQRNNRMSQ
jgi:hypothetical protein